MQEGFDDDFFAGVAKAALAHDAAHGVFGFGGGLADDDAFAGGQSRGFDDEGVGVGFEVGERGVDVGEALVSGGFDAVFLHEGFGVAFAAFEGGGALVGAEDGESFFFKEIDDAVNEGLFGPDDGEVDVVAARKFAEAADVGERQVFNALKFGGAAVAGGDVDAADAGVLGEFPGDGVFAAAAADDEDFEHGFPCVGE